MATDDEFDLPTGREPAHPGGEMPGGEMPGGEMPGGEMPGGGRDTAIVVETRGYTSRWPTVPCRGTRGTGRVSAPVRVRDDPEADPC